MFSDAKRAREAEIGGIVSRLHEEIRRTQGTTEAHDRMVRPTPAALSARREAESLWPVTAERRLVRSPGPRGRLVYVTKLVLRRLMRWYVEPLAAEQRSFNAATLQRTTELEERLTRLERRSRTAPLGTEAARPEYLDPAPPPRSTPTAIPDYFAFEARMRGSTPAVRTRQAVYVDDFRDAAPALDIGCGRGEFLALLAQAGVQARGVDVDADMVAFCRGQGLDVVQGEAHKYLDSLPKGSLGGIFCAHVLEHFPPAQLMRLLELAAAKLRGGGVLVAETPNPRTLVAISTFFADLTHVQPLHPETLSLLARQAGFERIEVRYVNEPPPEGRLRSLPDAGRASLRRVRDVADGNFQLLNDVVFGPQDYALVARR